ncbi:hypothetical protein Tco_0882044 [Tanacetum coccineum]
MTSLLKVCLLPLALKAQNDSFEFVFELKQELFADLQYVQSLTKEIDELEYDKSDFSNIYDLLLQECISKDVMCSYLHSLSDLNAHTELKCLYRHKIKECECLAEKLSKQTKNGLESVSVWRIQGVGYGVLEFLRARIHRIFLDGYGVLVVRTLIFKISLFKL